MVSFFETILYQPVFNIFVALYNLIPDVGAVIVIMTVAIKGGLYPLTKSSLRAQKSLKKLQPKLKKIKEKYDDQQKIAEKTMELYKENKVNPFSSCLPILIQIPIFIALYWVLRNGLGTSDFHLLYSFVSAPEQINPVSLGLVDLAKSGNVILALSAAVSQYFQAKSMSTSQSPKEAGAGADDENMMSMMNKQMYYVMPVITLVIGYSLPAGVALYWFLSTATTAIQQKIVFGKIDEDEEENIDKTGEDEDNDGEDSGEDDEVVLEGEVVD